MIAASRRRRPGVRSADETFRLHDRLARRTGWSLRIIRASVAALVASVLALLVGVGLTTHAIVIVATFFVVLALPVPAQRKRALTEIRSRVGLSYETALGLQVHPVNEGRGRDPYGFEAAVVERARLAAADVKPPPVPAWWLPALAVAASLLLVSSLDLLDAPAGSGLGGNGGAPAGTSPAPFEDRQEQDDGLESLTPPDEAPGRAEEPESSDENRPTDDGDSGSNAPPPADGDGDSAPMSRFLDSLRERPPESGGGQGGQDQGGQTPPQTQAPGQVEPGASRDGEPQRVELPADADDQDGAEGRSAAEMGSEEDGADGDSTLVGAESDEEGASDASSEEPGDSAGGGPGEDQESLNEPTEGGGEGQQGLEAGGAADGETSDDPAGEATAGAGAGPESPAGVADGEGGRPEFLPGVLGEGPESPAGAVRLPGQSDVTLPPGAASPAEYAAAAEEALSEGDLPLSYQEIIRRYFR